MRRFIGVSAALVALVSVAVASPAGAYHTTSVTINQSDLTVTAGGAIQLTGTVNPECFPGLTYGWDLSLGGTLPTEGVVISPQSGTTVSGYTADLIVPAGTAAGTYTLSVVGVMRTAGTGCFISPGAGDTPDDPAALRPTITVTVLAIGACPAGASGFVLTAMAHPADANRDGFVCVKQVHGKGNQGDGSNIKDNNTSA